MPPGQLQAELHQLFGYMPFNIYADFRPELERELLEGRLGPEHHLIISGMIRREKSEHRSMLLARLEELLKFSQVTRSCRQFILESFEALYAGGVGDELDKQGQDLPFFLDTENPESGGIFDRDMAKELESQAYKTYLNVLRQVPLVANVVDEQGREETLILSTPKKTMRLLRGWRQEVIKLYF